MTAQKKQIVVMDFSGVYPRESFTRPSASSWLNCENLSGTDCYCDSEAAATLRTMISRYPVHGIHFIDSGNYHYITKFWADRIRRPFSLILFDHHPDMQPPVFSGVLSCGGWVKSLIDTNPYLKKVIIVGASDELISAVPDTYRSRVAFYSENALKHESTWKSFSRIHLNEPVYISIDKDVLTPRSAATGWSQGSLSLDNLKRILAAILKKEEVIGIDVCGEAAPTSDIVKEEAETEINDRTNADLLNFFLHTPTRHTA